MARSTNFGRYHGERLSWRLSGIVETVSVRQRYRESVIAYESARNASSASAPNDDQRLQATRRVIRLHGGGS